MRFRMFSAVSVLAESRGRLRVVLNSSDCRRLSILLIFSYINRFPLPNSGDRGLCYMVLLKVYCIPYWSDSSYKCQVNVISV